MPKIIVSLIIFCFFFLFHTPVFADSTVVINEIIPSPSSGNDWVELYNSSQNDIDISGWILDDEGTSSDMLKIPDNTIIAKQSFKLFYVSNRLNKDGDTIYLKNGGNEIDKYNYNASETDVSFGRYPDGSDNWSTCTPTPESANSNCNVISEPSPTPTPTPTPTSRTSSSKSPTPTPKPSASNLKLSSPTPLNSPEVLAQKDQANGIASPSSSPTPSAEGRNPSKVKIASMLVGSGLILIGFSAAFYFWYRKTVNLPEEEKEKSED